jgi:Putative addiction module component
MALPFDKIKEEALLLDLDSRAALARVLLLSLDDLSDDESERLWLDEAERRQAEVRDGRVAMVPGDQVLERLNKALG